MKKLNKKIIVLSLILLGGIVTIGINNKKELNIKDNSKRLAVYLKQDDGSYKEANTIPSVGYTLNNEKSTCSNGAKPTWNNDGLNIANLTSNNTNCYLYFDKNKGQTIDSIISTLNAKTEQPDFSQIATTDEGVYQVSDGMYGGTSYYWRGAVNNNYVRFGGFCWRIVRINGDKTMRLIYDGTTCHANGTSTAESIAVASTAYITDSSQSNYVGWTYEGTSQRTLSGTPSNAKIQLDSWYNNNIIGTNASKVADGKYCNDRDVQSGSSWAAIGSTFYYAGYKRLYTDYAPILSCSNGDIYSLKVGLITADEVEFTGGKNENNKSYYLYNGQNYWTMSPRNWNGGNSWASMFYVNASGYLASDWVNSIAPGLRPVINLKSDTTFTGNGTIDNPFVVEGA